LTDYAGTPQFKLYFTPHNNVILHRQCNKGHWTVVMVACHSECSTLCTLLIEPPRDVFQLPSGLPAFNLHDLSSQQSMLAEQHHSLVLGALKRLKKLLKCKELKLRDPRATEDSDLPSCNSVLVEELSDERIPDAAFDPVKILLACSSNILTPDLEYLWSTKIISQAAEEVLDQLEDSLKEQHHSGEANLESCLIFSRTGWRRAELTNNTLTASIEVQQICDCSSLEMVQAKRKREGGLDAKNLLHL
jgi:hypothetical protein